MSQNASPSPKEKLKILISAAGCCILAFLLMILFVPKILGYQTFYIQTGSMSPSIPKGSLVFVKEVKFDQIKPGDVLTFHSDEGDEFFTHRVIEIDKNNEMFTTKGDANKEADPLPTSYYFVQGRADFSIPFVGYAAEFTDSLIGKVIIGAVYIAWLAVEIEIFIMKRKTLQEEETI